MYGWSCQDTGCRTAFQSVRWVPDTPAASQRWPMFPPASPLSKSFSHLVANRLSIVIQHGRYNAEDAVSGDYNQTPQYICIYIYTILNYAPTSKRKRGVIFATNNIQQGPDTKFPQTSIRANKVPVRLAGRLTAYSCASREGRVRHPDPKPSNAGQEKSPIEIEERWHETGDRSQNKNFRHTMSSPGFGAANAFVAFFNSSCISLQSPN